jgi:hypothetical protein
MIPDVGFVALLPVAFLGAFAGVAWIAALVLFLRALAAGARGVRVQGRVVGYTESMGRRQRMYSAIYEATVDGRALQCTSGIATSWRSPAVGTVVTLLYRPHDPEKPLLVLGFARFLWCTIFAGVALILTVPAIAATLSVLRVFESF